MKSRTFFNPVIFWKDLARFWLLWALELFMLQIVVTLPLLSKIGAAKRERVPFTRQIRIMEAFADSSKVLASPWLIAGFCIFAAVFVFSCLNREREAYMLHSLPLTRDMIFASHYLAGLTMLALPFAVTCLPVLLLAAANGAGETAIPFLGCLAEAVIEIFLFYHLGCFAAMLTGNSVMTVIVYVVSNGLYAGAVALCSRVGEKLIYGSFDFDIKNGTPPLAGEHDILRLIGYPLEERIFKAMTPVSSLGEWIGMDYDIRTGIQWAWRDFRAVACFLIPAAVFLTLSVLLYRRRSIECAGEMLVFSWAKSVFKVVFSFSGGILFTLVLFGFCFEDSISSYDCNTRFWILLIMALAGVFLSFLLGSMMLDRSFRIWNKKEFCMQSSRAESGHASDVFIFARVRMAALAAAVVCGMFYSKLEIGRYTPRLERVKSLSIGLKLYGRDNRFYFYDEGEWKEFQKIEQEILTEGPKLAAGKVGASYMKMIHVTYQLDDKSTITREYPILAESYADLDEKKLYQKMKQFISSTCNMCYCLFGKDYENVERIECINLIPVHVYTDVDITEEEICLVNEDDDKKDRRNIRKLYPAVLADIEAERYQVEKRPENALGYIEIRLEGAGFPDEYEELVQQYDHFDYEGDMDDYERMQEYKERYPDYFEDVTVKLAITEACTETIHMLKEMGMDHILDGALDE